MRFKPFTRRYLILIFIAISLQTGVITQGIAQSLFCLPLDTFTASTQASEVELNLATPGPLNILDDGSPSARGSFRNIEFGPLTGTGATLSIESGLLTVSPIAGSFAPVSVLYDANGSGLNIDLSDDIAIAFNLRSNDRANTAGSIVLTDSGNNVANLEILNMPNIQDGDSLPTRIEFPFEQFADIGSLDLTDIHSIELNLIPTQNNADFGIASFDSCRPYVPPVPVSTLSNWMLITLAVLFGLMGVMVLRRKKASLYH